MEKLRFFDINCLIGRVPVPQLKLFSTPAELLKEMDYAGIEEALVYHSLAQYYSPGMGNARVLDEIKGYPRLHGCWVLLPHHTDEIPEPEILIKRMLKEDVKAARIFPQMDFHAFSTDFWSCGELFAALEYHRIPLFFNMNLAKYPAMIWIDQESWNAVYRICEKYRSLPVILTDVDYRINRKLYPLLEKFKNLYIEISGYMQHRGIEGITKRFGAERLFFGSRLPFFSPGAALMMVNYAKISWEEKQLIAGDNFRRLIKEIR